MDEETRNELILYRLRQANETISEAGLLIEHKKYRALPIASTTGCFMPCPRLELDMASRHLNMVN